jgi:hypothetical protein
VALRRRARILGAANAIAFLIPSLVLLLPPRSETWFVVLPLLSSFPIIMAFAMVRHGMFDLRIVLRRGIVYAFLSVSLLIGYLGLVLFVGKSLGRRTDSPWFMGAALVVFVLLLSLAQLRLQHVVNRWVFRGHYIYSDALVQASHDLARARSREGITQSVREALLGAMGLLRVSFAVQDQSGRLTSVVVGSEPDPLSEQLAPALPTELEVANFAPIARALNSGSVATAYDPIVASSQVVTDSTSDSQDPDRGRCGSRASPRPRWRGWPQRVPPRSDGR